MRDGLSKESELKIVRFIKGLSLNVYKKVDLQLYLSFDDVCNLAIKVEKQYKGRNFFHTSVGKTLHSQ